MATGRRAFEGKTKTSLIAAIVSSQPTPIAQLQPLSPPALDHIIERCLAKDPSDRWQSAKDVSEELKWISEKGSQAGVAAPLVMKRKTRERLAWSLAALLAVAAIGFAFLWSALRRVPRPRIETSILAAEKTQFAFDVGSMMISPDGSRVVYPARGADNRVSLWVRPLRGGAAQILSGTEGGGYPFWSSDSRFIGFFAGGKLKKIDASGGPPQTLCDADDGRGGTWSSEGTILFAPGSRDAIHRVSAGGGPATAVTQLGTEEYSHRFPWFLPDGKHFLFLSQSLRPGQERARVMAGEMGSKATRMLLATNSPVMYSPEGFLLFCRERSLLGQAFNLKTLALSEEPFPIAEKLQTFSNTGVAAFSVSRNGLLIYQNGGAGVISQLLWVDRSGKPGEAVGIPANYYRPRLSHDGLRVAVEIVDEQVGFPDIWIYDLVRKTPTRFTFEPFAESGPVWSPDDQSIAYAADGASSRVIMKKLASGAGAAQVIGTSDSPNLLTMDWSRDGRWIVSQQISLRSRNGWDVMAFDTAAGRLTPYLSTRFNELNPFLSPDGRWITYTSNESGRNEIYVQPFPQSGGKWQISTAGGNTPRWRADGKELYFAGPDQKMMAVTVTTEPTFSASVPTPLFEFHLKPQGGYDVAADGKRFLLNTPLHQDDAAPMTLVQNWTADLKR